MSALQARLHLPRVALYAGFLAVLTLIAIMYLAMTQWFTPWQPLALMALLSIPLGGFSAYVALELPSGAALKPDHVIPGALLGGALFVVIGVAGSLIWQAEATRVTMLELASARKMWEVPTQALADEDEAIAAAACHELVQSGELTQQRVAIDALLRRPTLTSACLAKSDPAQARRVANGVASPWLKGLFEHQGDEALVCAGAANLSAVVPHANYVVHGLLTCSLEATQGRACCASALTEHGLKGATLSQAMREGEDLTAGAWVSGLLQASFHQKGMDAPSKARAASLGLMSVEMRALALERACAALSPAPSDALMTQLVAVADAQCGFDARARRKDLSFWQNLCGHAQEAQDYSSDQLCAAGERQLRSQATRQARAWVHAALGLKSVTELMSAIREGATLLSPFEQLMLDKLEAQLRSGDGDSSLMHLHYTPEYYQILQYARGNQLTSTLSGLNVDPEQMGKGIETGMNLSEAHLEGLSMQERAYVAESLKLLKEKPETLEQLRAIMPKLSATKMESIMKQAQGAP